MQGDSEFTNAGGLRGVIRRSKTDQFGEGRLVYSFKRSHGLLRKWLRRKPASSRMVFCAISHGTCLDRAICDRSVNEIIKKAVARVKIPGRPDDRAVSGHSLSVGARPTHPRPRHCRNYARGRVEQFADTRALPEICAAQHLGLDQLRCGYQRLS